MNLSRSALVVTLTLALAACGSSTTAPGGGQLVLAISGTLSVAAVTQTSQLTLTATQAPSPAQTVTNQATWSTSDATVATVSTTGLVTAQGYGNATITAAFQGTSTTAVFTVSMAGTWTSAPFDKNGNEFTWTITQSGSTVTGAIGFVPGLPTGDAFSTSSITGTVTGTTFTWTMTLTASADPNEPQCAGVPFVITGTAQILPGGTSMSVAPESATGLCDKNEPGGDVNLNGESVTFTKG